MKKQILTFIFGLFILASVSALYGGESTVITFDFEPMACNATDNLDFQISSYDVSLDIPVNFLGNFTVTCFSGTEANPVVVYRNRGGGRTKYVYENVTEYINNTIEVEKIVEVKIPGEQKILEKMVEVSANRRGDNILFACLLLIILGLILWNFKRSEKQEDTNRTEKEVEKNE